MFLACVSVILFLFNTWIDASLAPSHGKVVVCYLGSWAVYRPNRGSFAIENLDPRLCTHLIYTFAGLNVSQDSLRSLDPWQDLTEDYGKGGYKRITALKNNYPHLKVSLAVGGWNEGSTNYSRLVADPSRRNRFVASSLDFIRKYNFDGLDLDWEFPGKRGGTKDDKTNFLLLVKELRAAFRKHNLLLTAAFSAGKDTIDVAYDVEGLSVYLDFIHMMCYDYHGPWDRKTGANAPLKGPDTLNVEYSINYMLSLGAPPRKLVMGIPFYGRTFFLEAFNSSSKRKPRLGSPATNLGFAGPFTAEGGFMGYNEICLELRNLAAHWKIYWDDESRTPFAISEDKVIVYDNEQSIAEKIHFAMEKGLAGAMVWSIDTDDFHGDCSEGENERFVNFPLMRCINKSIVQSLKDLENTVKDTKTKSGEDRIRSGLLGIFIFLFKYFI
ncbi:probable chitinase 2 [Diorhabda carinulata]|uniref:probable chitinase 2 n=1 Tax=Diorhabda carinulata TaxID=1163345 RepID=UPI0025A12006|nr:probable chitinase 2 [Diorhabda carinulata]